MPEFGFPDLWRRVHVSDGAAQGAAELLRELGHCQRLGTGQVVDLADMRLLRESLPQRTAEVRRYCGVVELQSTMV